MKPESTLFEIQVPVSICIDISDCKYDLVTRFIMFLTNNLGYVFDPGKSEYMFNEKDNHEYIWINVVTKYTRTMEQMPFCFAGYIFDKAIVIKLRKQYNLAEYFCKEIMSRYHKKG